VKDLQEGQGAFDGIKLACLLDMKKYRRRWRLCLLMLKEAQKMDAEDLKTEEDKETGQCWKIQRSGQVRIGKTAWIRKTFYVRFIYVQEESIRKNRFFSISKLGSFSSLLYFT